MTPLPAETLTPHLDFAAISTHASVLENRNRLVLRYSDAILAYATALLKNREEAEDAHMEIVKNMLEGKFSKATTPLGVQQGRFRFYVRRAVHHALLNHIRKRTRDQNLLRRCWNAVFARKDRSGLLPDESAAPPVASDLETAEGGIWRATVLDRALKALEDYERNHQEQTRPNVYHTLARMLIDNPGTASDELADRLGAQAGGEFNAGQTRGIVMRMRMKLAELLVAEIVGQLDEPSYENVLEELSDLGLFAYVEPYLPAAE